MQSLEDDILGLSHPELFLVSRSGTMFRCQVCPGQEYTSLSRARRHEDTTSHVQYVRTLDIFPHENPANDGDAHSDEGSSPRSLYAEEERASFQNQHTHPIGIHGPALLNDLPDQIYDDYAGALEANRGSSEEEVLEDEAQEELSWERGLMSDGPLDLSSDAPVLMSESDLLRSDSDPVYPDLEDQRSWWPWNGKDEALLDIMSAFPRSMFSENEMEVTRWFAENLGVEDLPSVKQVKDHRKQILMAAGASPQTVESALGNMYTHNDLKKILQHEFANPLTRPHIQTYPEDSYPHLQEATQADRWKTEIEGILAAPMARGHGDKDFFVNEPCLADLGNEEGEQITAVIPIRWFKRDGQIWAKAHLLLRRPDINGFVVDARESGCTEIPLEAFFLNVVDLEDPECQQRYNIPCPRILGILKSCDTPESLSPWSYEPRNPWRAKAQGKRVFSVPIWLYCDDTSGNTSKKWNKHDSILFTLAGLPQDFVHMLYNIHFIATSNIASPLEMMEYVCTVLQELRNDGVEVWDCQLRERVLLLVWALAFQGDNPMASEFASHIGMSGTMFCRVCHAKGMDGVRRAEGEKGLAAWLQDCLSVNSLRDRQETLDALNEQLARALSGAPSGVSELGTATGVKDKYFQHFVDVMQAAIAKFREQKKGTADQAVQVREFLANLRQTFPEDIFSPVLNIPEFDANTDSPVEILHVILLGVVKYWWRDAVSRLNSDQKDELKTRLSSLDVLGLNIARLRGSTLVQYAGSLVGRDFRVILQVAPSVLQGLIPDIHYQAWLALCRLAPMIFQPSIANLPAYLNDLEDAILQFLGATALWNLQWFNKAKFHLFLHLPFHIRRFGPALLYATESFESYNFVIRLRSIHSSKHAPSIDIANAFSHVHAVRHLVSGGYVFQNEEGDPIAPRQAGSAVLRLMNDPRFKAFMTMSDLNKDSDAGRYSPLFHLAHCEWRDTKASSLHRLARRGFWPTTAITMCRSLVLRNGDILQPNGYVIYQARESTSPLVGRTEEILVLRMQNRLLGVLVTRCDVNTTPIPPYYLPKCSLALTPDGKYDYMLVPFESLLCAINTFHNCAAHDCKVTQTSAVIQERVRTGHFKNEITHQIAPDDRLLNTAQLRSAEYIRPFQVHHRYPGLPLAELVDQAVANKREAEMKAVKDKEAKEAEKQAKAMAKEAKQAERQARAAARAAAKAEKEAQKLARATARNALKESKDAERQQSAASKSSRMTETIHTGYYDPVAAPSDQVVPAKRPHPP